MQSNDKILNHVCVKCNKSTIHSECPVCGNEQYCPSCKACNICGPIRYGDLASVVINAGREEE